jgi:subtilisin family serine protease
LREWSGGQTALSGTAWRVIASAALFLAVAGLGPAVGPSAQSGAAGSLARVARPGRAGWAGRAGGADQGRAFAALGASAPYVPGQLLIKMAGGASAGAPTLLAAAGAEILETIPQLGLAVVQTVPNADLGAVAAELTGMPEVEWAEPNYIFGLDAVPNDPYYLSYQSSYLGLMQMPAAWDYTTGQPQVVIAVLDTGVDLAHPDLREGVWTNPGEVPGNGLDDDANGYIDDVHGWDFADNDNLPDDDHGHGTHVAGIAAARINNGLGIAGIAGHATIMPVDVFGGGIGTYDSLIRAIIYATDNGARVINMSLGATSYSRGEEAAVNYAWSHGVVLVAAAGNTGLNTYHYPAAHAHAIAVAATDAGDRRASFSTYGDFVDVSAPGVSVWSTVRGSSYGYMNGTSMATPHVSGLAALILSVNPGLTPDMVRDLIEQNADDLGSPGWDIYFGYGRINALRALAQVLPNPPPTPVSTPGPPLGIWPAGCRELTPDGDFESGLGGWQTGGSVSIDGTRVYSGTKAAHFPGAPGSRGVLTRTLELLLSPIPSEGPFPQEGTLWFAFRIEGQDRGWGSSPPFPYDDWLTAELRTDDGRLLGSLLRTGNSADTANDGLPWDQFLYRMQPADFAALGAADSANLVFTSGNDGDSLPTDFWVDAVRFCVSTAENPAWPDLVALDLEEADPGQCSSSIGGGVRFTVANGGQANASNFYVRVSTQGGYQEWQVAALPAGESLQFTWAGVPGLLSYTGTVDQANTVVESDETNNRLTRELKVEPACTPTPTPTATGPYRIILLMVFQNASLRAGNPALLPEGTPIPAP